MSPPGVQEGLTQVLGLAAMLVVGVIGTFRAIEQPHLDRMPGLLLHDSKPAALFQLSF